MWPLSSHLTFLSLCIHLEREYNVIYSISCYRA